MTVDTFLASKGYGERVAEPIYRKDGVFYWYRKVPGTERHQYVVRMWPALSEGMMPSFEIEMTYETRNEIWGNTKYYGLSYTQLCANLDRLEGCLKQSLLYMDANPLHYHFDGEN